MRNKIFLFFAITTALSFAQADRTRFDSAQTYGVDGEISELVIKSEHKNGKKLQDEIATQLFYLVGMLNSYKSAADLGHVKIKINRVIPARDGYEVHYSAYFLVGWPRKAPLPLGIPLVFPISANESSLIYFYKKYRKSCSEDSSDSDLSVVSFYYYFRPEKESCPLMKKPNSDVHSTLLALKLSQVNTEGKFPEYGKVWEDNSLVATLIFGKFAEGATSNQDAGISAYNNMYRSLRSYFGSPEKMNVSLGANAFPGVLNPDIEMHWELFDHRRVNIDLLLVDKMGLTDPPEAFIKKYGERTKFSDYVSYNGHSGFGENIRALAGMGHFVKGQYQFYFINGCDTFFYVDDSLRSAHEAVNPGSSPYRYFDIMTNALPSWFQAEVPNNLVILKTLMEKKKTYREMLSEMKDSQYSIVMGEEDNRWPAPF